MRQMIDCRDLPSDSGCTLALAADTEAELLAAAVAHAATVHRHPDSPQLRAGLREAIKPAPERHPR